MRLATFETIPFGPHKGTPIATATDSQIMDVAGDILCSEHAEDANHALWAAIEPYFLDACEDQEQVHCLACFMPPKKCTCCFHDNGPDPHCWCCGALNCTNPECIPF